MKILSMETSNFRLHADSAITFPGEGVVGIIGSNETGKSTILEALMWALFGARATRGSKGSLRWHRAPARRVASVTVRFAIGGKTYSLERSENTARLVDEASGTCVAESTSGVDGYVPGLLGMSHDEFRASFLCSQRDLNRLAAMGPTERQAFVRSVLGVGKIDDALKSLRKRKNELASERQGMEAGMGERQPLVRAAEEAEGELRAAEQYLADQDEAVALATATLEAAEAALTESKRRKGEHDRLSTELREAEFSLSGARAAIERLTKELEEAEAAAKVVDAAAPELAALPGLREEREGLREARARQDERTAADAQVRELREDVDRVAHALTACPEVTLDEAEWDAAFMRAGRADKELKRLQDERRVGRERALAEAKAAQREAARLERQAQAVHALGADGPCPTCTRTLGDALDGVMDGLTALVREQRERESQAYAAAAALDGPSDDEVEAQVESDAAHEAVEHLRGHRSAVSALIRRREELLAEQERVQARLEKAEARRASIPGGAVFDAKRLEQIESEVLRLEKLDASLNRSRGMATRIPTLRSSIEEERARAVRAEQDVERIKAAVVHVGFDVGEHGALTADHHRASTAVQEARMGRARAEDAHARAKVERRRAGEALVAYDERASALEDLVEQHRLHEKADARLSDFRVAVAGTIRPDLEDLVSGFVGVLTDGRHEAVTLSEDFTPVLHESGVPTEVVSGGTEDITALAMRLAISQMIAERAGHPLSLLILDEPFGSLDETRRGNVLALIRRLRGVFDQVVVISHVAETRDAVDHVLELEFDEAAGMTRVHSGRAAVEVVA